MESYWSKEDNHRLKRAMIKYPSEQYEKQERWRKIARFLGNRTKRDCYNQYKVLKQQYRQQRQDRKAAKVGIRDLKISSTKASDHLRRESNAIKSQKQLQTHAGRNATGHANLPKHSDCNDSEDECKTQNSGHRKVSEKPNFASMKECKSSSSNLQMFPKQNHETIPATIKQKSSETKESIDPIHQWRGSQSEVNQLQAVENETVTNSETRESTRQSSEWQDTATQDVDVANEDESEVGIYAKQLDKFPDRIQEQKYDEMKNESVKTNVGIMSPTEMKLDDCDTCADEYDVGFVPSQPQSTLHVPDDGSICSETASWPSQQPNGPRDKSHKISIDAARSIREVLFGSRKPNYLNDAWRKQGFFFSNEPDLGFGLIQLKGGPCGVIAAVQAYLLRELFYSEDDVVAKSLERTNTTWMNPSPVVQRLALSRALAAIVWQAAEARSVSTLHRAPVEAIVAVSSSKGMGLRRGPNYKPDGFTEEAMLRVTTSLEQTRQVFAEALNVYTQSTGPGVGLLVISILLSRGVGCCVFDHNVSNFDLEDDTFPNVADDIDSGLGEASTLIGNHSYAGQELVNLLLTGKATSNVFDGDKVLGDGGADTLHLHGITQRAKVGFLSLFEHYGHVSTGTHLKTPECPIWVVCSESHYSVLFAPKSDQLDVHTAIQFDLHYYDELGQQDELYRLTVNCEPGDDFQVPDDDDASELIPPLESCIRTKWKGAQVDWNGADPLL